MRTLSTGRGIVFLLLFSGVSFIAFGAMAQTTQPGDTINIDVNDPRPLLAAVQEIEQRFGWVVTYEDPPFVAVDDFEDVTLSTRRTPQGPKILVPRGGPFAFRRPLPAAPTSARDRQLVLQALLEQYRTTGYPGEFALISTGDVSHVIPIGSKDSTGQSARARSLLDRKISIPTRERTALDMVRAIAGAVSRPSEVQVTEGTVPINLMLQVRVQDGANNETARTVLLRLIDATQRKLSWALLCDPGTVRECALNIHLVEGQSGSGR